MSVAVQPGRMGRTDADGADHDEYRAVLLYHPDDTYAPAAAKAVRRRPDVGALRRDDPIARSFLDAQFETPPAAVVLVDAWDGRVSVGRPAARDLVERAGMTGVITAIAETDDARDDESDLELTASARGIVDRLFDAASDVTDDAIDGREE